MKADRAEETTARSGAVVAEGLCSAVVSSFGDMRRTRATLAQLRHLGIAPIVVVEHEPTAESRAALAEEERRGDVWVWQPRASDPPELVGRALATLVRAIGPAWTLFIDAGDLPLCRSGSLADVADLEAGDILSVARYEVAIGPDGPWMPDTPAIESADEVLVHARPSLVGSLLDEEPGDAAVAVAPLTPRTIVRADAVAEVRWGGRDVETTDVRPWHRGLALELVIARLPGRRDDGYDRWAVGPLRIEDPVEPPVIHERALARLRREGVIRSAGEIMDAVIPEFTSEEHYLATIRSPQPWLSMAELVCRAEGLDPAGLPEVRTTPNRAIVLIPPDRYIKIYGPWREGMASIEREASGLARLARDPDLPAPRLLARGALTDTWHYTVQSRVAGRPLARVRGELDPGALPAVAAWLGRFIRRLQAIPVTDEEREEGWAGFRDEVAWRHRSASTLIDGFGGLPGHLVGDVAGWLPPMDELLSTADDFVVTHGDLKDAHVLGDVAEGRFEPHGVIDFGSSRVGHPYWDLGPIWWCICRGDRELFAAFLAEAGLPGVDEPEFPKRALAWATLRPCWGLSRPTEVERADTLDDLAMDWFGSTA